MASTVSTVLKIELMADGENENTWGLIANRNFEVLERAGAGHSSLAIAGATTTLTATANQLGTWHYHSFKCTGTLTANSEVIVPNQSRVYLFENATTGAFTLTVKTAAGTGVVIPTGQRAVLTCDATNVTGVVLHPYDATGYLPLAGGTITGNLIISKTSFPQWVLLDSDAAADAKRWAGWIDNANGNFILGTQTDATTGTARLTVTRAGVSTFGAQVQGPAGTAALPAFSFSGDTNTGMRLGGTDIVTLVTNGADRVNVSAVGDVGINTSVTAMTDHRLLIVKGPNTGLGYSSIRVEGGGSTKQGIFQTLGTAGDIIVGTDVSNTTGTLALWAGGGARAMFDATGNASIGPGFTPLVFADYTTVSVKGPNSGPGGAAFRLVSGIGTKQATFQIGGTNGDVTFGTSENNTTGVVYFQTNLAPRMTLDTDGNLNFLSPSADILFTGTAGTNSVGYRPALTHQLANTQTVTNYGVDDGGGWSGLTVTNYRDGTYSSQWLSLKTAKGGSSTATDRLIIDALGNIGFQTAHTAPGYFDNTIVGGCMRADGRLFVNGVSWHHFGVNAAGAVIGFALSNLWRGSIDISSGGVAYTSASDYRLKENVQPLTGALTRLGQLAPKRFNFIGDDTTVDGFLAHEVQPIVPNAVTGTHNGTDFAGNPEYQAMDPAKLVPLLVGAIQELVARVAALENP